MSTIIHTMNLAAEAQEAAIAEGLSDQQKGQLYELLSTLSARRGLDADVPPRVPRVRQAIAPGNPTGHPKESLARTLFPDIPVTEADPVGSGQRRLSKGAP